ncbi:hypothetical protein MRX96_013023 [Rhipicephalus microplus]
MWAGRKFKRSCGGAPSVCPSQWAEQGRQIRTGGAATHSFRPPLQQAVVRALPSRCTEEPRARQYLDGAGPVGRRDGTAVPRSVIYHRVVVILLLRPSLTSATFLDGGSGEANASERSQPPIRVI